MTKLKHIKRALICSIVAFVLCFSMLLGTTFAWFTDTVKSSGNKIVSGTLKVDLIHAHYPDNAGTAVKTSMKENSDHKIFDYDLWEPGYTQIEYFEVINHGNLHFKYEMRFTSAGELTKLADVIEVYVGDPTGTVGQQKDAALENMTLLGTVSQVMNEQGGRIFQGNTVGLELTAGATVAEYAVALHMQESATDEYQELPLFDDVNGFNVTLLATQTENEFDGFGNDYDNGADYAGEISNEYSLRAAFENGGSYVLNSDVALTAPAVVAEDAEVELNLNGNSIITESGNAIQNKGKLVINGEEVAQTYGLLSARSTETEKNALVSKSTYAVNNSGTVELNGVYISGLYNAGEATLNDVTIENTISGKHGVYHCGSELTINGGEYSTTSGNELIYAASSNVTINGGTFTQLGKSYLFGPANAGIVINGGTFNGYVNDNGTNDQMRPGAAVVNGGSFNFNPTAWFAADEKLAAVQDENGLWVVYGAKSTLTMEDGATLDLKGVEFPGTVVAEGDLMIKGDAKIKTLTATNGGKITLEEDKTLTLNDFSFGAKANASAEYVIEGGTVEASYGFFQHGKYELRSDFNTGYMYYSYGSDITVYGTFHSQGLGDGLDYVRGKLTVANGGQSIHDKVLWVGQPASWGEMHATLVIEEGGYVQANTLNVYDGSSLEIDAKNLVEGEYTGLQCNTLTMEGTLETLNNGDYKAIVNGNKLVLIIASDNGLLAAIKNASTTEETTILLGTATFSSDILFTVDTIGEQKGDIVFKAAEGETPLFTGTIQLGIYVNGTTNVSKWTANITFENITFDHTENDKHSLNVQNVGKDDNANALTLKNCKIIGFGEYGIGSVSGNIAYNSQIIDCTFENAAMQITGNFGTGLVIDNCTFNESVVNVQGGNGVTVKNSKFTNTLTDAHNGESFYCIRSNDNPITVTNCNFAIDSTVTGVGVAGDKGWGVFVHRGTTKEWNLTDVTVTLTDAAKAQQALGVAVSLNGGKMTCTNVTVNGETLPCNLLGGKVETISVDGVTYTKVADGLLKDEAGNLYVCNAVGLQNLHAWLTDTTNGSYNMRVAFWGKTYNVMVDIDATGYIWETVETNMDSGDSNGITFNGNGHTIKNLTITGNGLFTGATQGTNAGTTPAVFKDITFYKATLTGGSHHNGVIWGEVTGSITLENVHVVNSHVTGGCNVGGLIGRNSESHAVFTFKNCSVKNTTIEATTVADFAGASAFLGAALNIETSCSAQVIFEGTNVSEGNTLTSATGLQGGGIYTTIVYETNWENPTVVDDFKNYNSKN